MRKVLLLGIGKELRGDSSIAILIAKYLESLDLQVFDIKYEQTGYFNLFDSIKSYDKVIIIIVTKKAFENPESLKTLIYEKTEFIDKFSNCSAQERSMAEELKLAEESVPDLFPKDIKFVIIEIPFQNNYSNRITKHTKILASHAIVKIFAILESYSIKIYRKESINVKSAEELDIFL